MNSDLEIVINKIKENTGIDVSLFSESKKFFISTSNEKVDFENFSFEKIFSDKKGDKTYFKTVYKNAKLIGCIKGSGEVEQKFATLIAGVLEDTMSKTNVYSEQDQLKAILQGEVSKVQIQKYIKNHNISSNRCFCLIAILGTHKPADILEILENYSQTGQDLSVVIEEDLVCQIKFVDDNFNSFYQSPTKYAESLIQSVENELGFQIDVAVGGTVSSFLEVSSSYSQALMTMRMKDVLQIKGEAYSFKGMFLSKVLEELPKFKIEEYLRILVDESAKIVFNDVDMILTAEEFLKNDLNFSQTARKLYLHRNTLVYRLDKIEKLTGLDIRKFSDAVTFRLITLLYKLIK